MKKRHRLVVPKQGRLYKPPRKRNIEDEDDDDDNELSLIIGSDSDPPKEPTRSSHPSGRRSLQEP